jgi:DNA-binding HxlR family transcriptional regulator
MEAGSIRSDTSVAEAGREVPATRATPPTLRALPNSAPPDWASASDRQMIEATSAAASLFSAKWKIDLLFLLAAGVCRHSRLHDHLVVSKKVLSEALKSLERDGLVRRRVFAETPVRVEYSLTPLGRSLTGPLFALCEWAEEHLDHVVETRRDYDVRNGVAPEKPPLRRFSAAFQIRGDGAS